MMIDTQRKINQEGAMRSICMLSKDALATNIKERVQVGENLSELPSLILLDYDMDRQDGECLELIRKEKRLAVVPLFFLCDEKNERIEEETNRMKIICKLIMIDFGIVTEYDYWSAKPM